MINNWLTLPIAERLNVLTHALGLVLVLVGTPFLLIEAFQSGEGTIFWCFFVFTTGMVWMYISSTLYHLAIDPGRKKLLRKIDHLAIFGLIGGTYTPFISIYYSQLNGWLFLSILWLIIVTGMIVKIFHIGRSNLLTALIYLALGWMFVFIYQPLTAEMSFTVLLWLLVGGISYTTGVIFYLWKRFKFHHAVWHLFVVGGTMSHYFSLYHSL